MDFFEGLLSYEIALLVMGVLFFAVLLFLLIYLVINKRSYKGIIALFLFPVIMVGFPGIQKIRFDNGIVEIDRLTRAIEKNPANAEAKKTLELKLSELKGREISTVKNRIIMEKAARVADNVPMAVRDKKRIVNINHKTTR